jgi:membrane protease YdiL (CAAX protease family)
LTARSLLFADDGRLQPPWRILLFLLLCASSILVVTIALRPILQALQETIGIAGVAASYGTAIALLVAHWLTLRSFDRRSYEFVGLHKDAARPPLLLFGWLMGAAPIVITALILFGAGWLEVVPATPGSWWKAAAQISLLLLPAALYEELLARGYVFATLREWAGPTTAIVLTSVGFGLLHVANPGSNPLPIAVVTLAGGYLAAVLIMTRSLYAAWLAHWGWNWILAVALHIPVSGLPFDNPDYKSVETGPDWITGGTWGPEGGAVAAVGMLAGGVFLYYRGKAKTRCVNQDATTDANSIG